MVGLILYSNSKLALLTVLSFLVFDSASVKFVLVGKKLTCLDLLSFSFVVFLYLNKDTELNQKYMLPYANAQIRYRINRSKYLSFKYDYDNTLPTPKQLIPVTNLSNPLVTIIGNPNLKPNETHTASVNFKNYNYRTRSGYSLYLKTNLFLQEIATTAFFDENGKKTTTYTIF